MDINSVFIKRRLIKVIDGVGGLKNDDMNSIFIDMKEHSIKEKNMKELAGREKQRLLRAPYAPGSKLSS